MCSLLSCVQLFAANGLQPTRLLCPWDSLGKDTGAGSHALLQGIVLIQGTLKPLFAPALVCAICRGVA